MAIDIGNFAPDNLPEIEYVQVDKEEEAYIRRAIGGVAGLEISFPSLDTPEDALTIARERETYRQAKLDKEARERGAAFILWSGRKDEHTPEEVAAELYAQRSMVALMKVVRTRKDAHLYELLHEYYERPRA